MRYNFDTILLYQLIQKRGRRRGVVAKVLNFGIVGNEFKIKSYYGVYFRTNILKILPYHSPSVKGSFQ